MKKLFKNIQTLIIVVLIIVIFLLRECQGNKVVKPVEPVTIVKVETKYDTIVKEIVSYVPKYRTEVKWKTKIVHDTIIEQAPIDTLAILKDYFKVRVIL